MKKKVNPLLLGLLIGIIIIFIFYKIDFRNFGETDEEKNIRWAKEWLEGFYEVEYFDDGIDYWGVENNNFVLVIMENEGDRATQVVTGFDAITRAFPKSRMYGVKIIDEFERDCLYGLTLEEWEVYEQTTYGTIENISLIECV